MQSIVKRVTSLKWGKIAKVAAGGLMAVLLLCVAGVLYLNSASGQKTLIGWVNEQLKDSDGQIVMGPLQGSLFGDLTLAHITLSDQQGPYARLKDIHLNWSPLALVDKRLLLHDMQVDRLELMRLPEGKPAQEPTKRSLTLPQLPVDLEIKSFALSHLVINKNIWGVPGDFEAQGALKLTTAEGMLAQLLLVNRGKTRDEISLEVAYPGPDQDLNLSARVSAPGGGLFASLIGTDPQHDVEATLKGAGPIADWRGDFRMQIGETTIANAQLTHIGRALSLTARLDGGGYIPDTGAALLGRTARLTFTLTPDEAYAHSDLSLELKADTVTLTAKGGVTSENIEAADRIDVTLAITDARPFNRMFSPLNLHPFSLQAVITDLAQEPHISVTTDSLKAAYGADIKSRLSGRIEAILGAQKIRFSGEGRLAELTGNKLAAYTTLLSPGLDWQVAGVFDRHSQNIALDNFLLGNSRLSTTGAGQFNGQTGELAARMTSALTDFTDLAPEVSGRLQLITALERGTANSDLKATFSGDIQGFDLKDAVANDVIGPNPTFAADLNLAANGAIKLDALTLTARHATLTAALDVSAQQIIEAGGFTLAITDLATIDKVRDLQLKGGIDLNGKLSGALNDPDVLLETALSQFSLQDARFTDLSARLQVSKVVSGPSGDLHLTGKSNFGPLQGNVTFVTPEEGLHRLSDIVLTLGAYQTRGVIDLPRGAPATGELIVTTTGRPQQNAVSGNVSAKVTLSSQKDLQQISLAGDLRDLSLRTDQNQILTLEQARLTAGILLHPDHPQITLSTQFTGLAHPRLQVQEGQIKISQTDEVMQFEAQLTGPDVIPYALNFSGEAPPVTETGRHLSLMVTGTIGDKKIALADPLMLAINDQGVTSSPFELQLGEGTLRGQASLLKNDIQLTLEADNADLRPLVTFAPDLPLTGLLSGRLSFTASETATTGNFDFELNQLMLSPEITTLDQNLKLAGQGRITAQALELSATARLADHVTGQLAAQLPFRFDLSTASAHFPEDQPLSGTASLNGDVRPLWPAVNLASHDLGGVLAARLTLGGTLANPDIDGQISLTKGRYENLKLGFVAADVDMAATIANRHLTLDHLTANDAAGGQISADADIALHPDLTYDARAKLVLTKARLVRQPELNITASADLDFLKSPETSFLKGDITVEKADIGALQGTAPEIPALDVREINLPQKTQTAKQTSGGQIGPFPLTIKVKAPGKMFIRSYGMDSEWKADLDITGTTDKPIVAGSASLVRGTFEFSGRKFSLTQGLLTFPGDKSNDPQLDIAAEHRLADMMAYLKITGRASAPKLAISSSPSLPQDEILARILFGTNVTDLSAIEALQLAAAVHSLSKGGGAGLLGGVRSALGIDRLSFDEDKTGDYGTTITGGKYLTNNIYVEVTTAPATGETATSIEVALSRSLSLVTRQTLDGGKDLALRWSWRY